MPTATVHPVLVSVDPDHMKVWLRLGPGVVPAAITADEVHAELRAANVAVDDAVHAEVKEFLERAKMDELGVLPVLVAEGRPPEEGHPGRFTWTEPPAAPSDDDHVNHRTFNRIRTVEKDEVIGQVIPPEPGKPGRDIHGNNVPPRKNPDPVKLAGHVRLAEDGRTAIAESAGRVVYEGNKLHILPVLEIAGDVDFESGNLDSTSDVSIPGTVRDLFEVVCQKNVTIGGAVEAAKVDAGDDVVVHGGILGRGQGVVRAGGRILAKFCDEAHLEAGGDVEITREAINSYVYTAGKLLAERAAIIGGEVYAREGAEVRNIGSDACVPTRIVVGIDPRVLKKCRQIEAECAKKQEAAGKIRNLVKPLMANLKRLLPSQREQATSLLYQADEVEESIKARLVEREELLAAGRPAAPPCVTVQTRIAQNACVVIDGHETVVHAELKGPVKIERRKVDNVTETVAVNLLTASVITLNSYDMDLSTVPDQRPDPFERAKAERGASAHA